MFYPRGTQAKGPAALTIAHRVTDHPADKVACIEDGTHYTYGDLRNRVGDIRHYLVAQGVRPGDHVSVAASSEYAFAVSLLGVLGVGAAVIPTNPLSPLPEMQRMLGPLRPRLIMASAMAIGMLDHGDEAPAPVISIDSIPVVDPSSHPPIVAADDDALALLMMTSGTSGPPKAAMIRHGNMDFTLNTMTAPERDGLLPDDTALCCLPTAHIFGLIAIAAVLQQGATAVLRDRFEAQPTLDLIAEHNITTVAGAPLMWRRWANVPDIDGNPMASVRRALSGAAALTPEVSEAIAKRYGVSIYEGYGMTETTSLISTNLGCGIRPGSVGPPVEGVEVMLVDADGTVVDEGDTGEVAVRGPGVFAGYFEDKDATDQVLTADGWLWTGDLAACDDNGYLFIVDRVKNVINVSGFNVYPAEVEEVLLEHPEVQLVAVTGSDDLERGETVIAYVIGTVEPAALREFANNRLASYKRPTEIKMVNELPLTAAGKVIRRELP